MINGTKKMKMEAYLNIFTNNIGRRTASATTINVNALAQIYYTNKRALAVAAKMTTKHYLR